jgi:Zn2+/Cd2+-exporting ATPase
MSDACCAPNAHATPDPREATADARARRELWLAGISGVLLATGIVSGAVGYPKVGIVFSLATVALSIVSPFRHAMRSLARRVLDINVLMVLAVAGALALGDFVEAASVVWLFGVAEWLEARSLVRARRAIRSLVTLAPDVALVRRDGREVTVPVESVAIGELLIVRPGERVPLDGVVASGLSTVNQAPITGESWPIEKEPGEEVFAGSINGAGALDVRVNRASGDSTLSRIVRLVEQAQLRRAPVQTFVERFARRYTPAVAILALGLAVIPPLVIGGASGWSHELGVWTYRALALLVVACPCALVISTPVAFVSALTAAARAGVLIKGGAHLETLGSIRCVAFDKTGTLTEGRQQVTHVLGVEGVSTHGVLSVAAALESRSEHPIGRAIVDHSRGRGLDVAPGSSYRALPGLGAEATVDEALAVVGSHRLFHDRQLCTPALHERLDEVTGGGATPVLVGHGGAALGVIGLSDSLRDGGRELARALRAEGVTRIALLTGDTRGVANATAAAAGWDIDEVHADLMPADKARLIETLRAANGPVAMVGDGVNDAPALAAADIGVAMGKGGTAVAVEAADVTLMSDDLAQLPYALRLGRATVRNVHTNVAIAVGLKLAFVVLASAGLATLWVAILADTGASLLVTANSLRLLRVR